MPSSGNPISGEEPGLRHAPAPGSAPASADARPESRHLTLAAIYMGQGQDEKACVQLSFFLDDHPDHVNARYYQAELLLRLDRTAEARQAFEAAVALLQNERSLELGKLIHCHGRLAEIAEKEENEYDRLLQRGIGLFWLSQAPAGSSEEEELVPAEGLLCKAAAALNDAHQLEPRESRPAWYLHRVWHKLGQNDPARRCLNLAQSNAPFSQLTPAEQRDLCLAAEKGRDR